MYWGLLPGTRLAVTDVAASLAFKELSGSTSLSASITGETQMTTTLFWCYFFQITGLICATSSGISKNKRIIRIFVLGANISSLLVMIFAGRYDGAAATFVGTFRSLLYVFRDRAKTNIIFWICSIAHIAAGLLTWQSPLTLLIIIATVTLCIVLWFGSVKMIKYGTLLSDFCWAIFDFSGGLYIEGARDFIEAASNVGGLWRESRAPSEALEN